MIPTEKLIETYKAQVLKAIGHLEYSYGKVFKLDGSRAKDPFFGPVVNESRVSLKKWE